MHTETLQAFVLSTLDYGDNDRIVTLFSLEHGRLKAFARSARTSRKRFGAALEPFARIDAQIRVKEGLSGLKQADIVSVYPAIRGDLACIAHALYACELVDALTPEGQPLARLFRLLTTYLDRLEHRAVDEGERRFFEINLLNILGYRPSLEHCSRCQAPFDTSGGRLQPDGEPLCSRCTSSGPPVSGATLTTLAACLTTGSFDRIPLKGGILDQAACLLDSAIAAHAGRRLKSLDFLRQTSP